MPAPHLTQAAFERLRPYERGGSTKRIKSYIDPLTGQVYSERQRQKHQRKGLTNEAFRELQKSPHVEIFKRAAERGERLKRLTRDWQYAESRKTGGRRPLKAVMNDPKFWADVDALNDASDTSPTGRKAQALVDFGYREPHSPWRVGESPKRQRARTHAAPRTRQRQRPTALF